ncbi:cytochrome P450 [Aspergillus pseudodeflectus]|uniref:Cytochrome P450 n=1 Tax=Aspergillus pseudodeflectus TaxID=176178 RepID=A0ABR4KSJ8_9EURO
MPPGPPTLPILGNLHQIPVTGLYKQIREWGNQYGGVFSLKFGSNNVIVLCDRRAVHELVDKKGLLYADRPHSYIGELLTLGDHMVVSSGDPLTRLKRKVATHNLSPRVIDVKLAPIQESEITQLVYDIMNTPDDFYRHLRRVTASIACTFIYGQRGATYESFWGHFGEALEPGANPPVDEFPFLKYWPTRFSYWKKRVLASREAMDAIWGEARAFVEDRRKRGIKRDCIADKLLDEYEAKGSPFTQHAFDMLLGELVEGGAETTSSSLLTVVLALARNPAIQERARKEIDPICGTHRSPTWTDFDTMPFVNCIVKEGMRFRPVISTGLPHRNAEEDEYEGMLIPKGSTILIPLWAIHHSERLGYTDPETFIPDRFLKHPKLANDYAGTERNQWRMVAKLLWAFDISEPIDPQTGKKIPLDPDAYETGLLHAPLPFKASIKVRSKAHADTIRREMDEAKKAFAQWE